EDGEPDAEARELTVDIAMFGGIFRDILGHIGGKDAVALPDDEMRGIGGIDHVDRANVAGIFLADALEYALRAGALDAHSDARIFGFERFGELLGDRQVGRGVVDHLTFLLRRLDQRRRDRLRRRRARHDASGERSTRKSDTRALEHVTTRHSSRSHFLGLVADALVGDVDYTVKHLLFLRHALSLSSTAGLRCS